METARIKEGKIALIVGILDVIIFFFFGVVFMAAEWAEGGASAAVYPMIIFLLFILPGMALILSYYRREIVFYDSYFIVRRTFGKERQYSYSEVDCIIAMKTRSEIRYILFGRQEGKRLAVFESNMRGVEEALDLLEKRNILYSDETLIKYAKRRNLSYKKIVKWRDRIMSMKDSNSVLRDAEEYTKIHYSMNYLLAERKWLRVLGIAQTVLSVICIFLDRKLSLAGWGIIVFLSWSVYLYLYPRAVFDEKRGKKQSEYVPQIPCAGAMISGFMLIVFINTLNSNGKDFFIFAGILWILFLLPFVIKMAVIRRRERKRRIAGIAVAAFVIAFMLVTPINYVATFQEPVHEDMTVSDKETSRSKSGTHYYLCGEWKGEETRFKVSKSIYQEAEKGDRMKVCIRTSIFGYSYWTVHKV